MYSAAVETIYCNSGLPIIILPKFTNQHDKPDPEKPTLEELELAYLVEHE